MAYESSQGLTFKFNGVAYTATSIAVSRSRGEIAVTSTDIPSEGGLVRYRPGGLKSMEIKVDWVGKTIPPTGGLYSFSLDRDDNEDVTDGDAGLATKALCTGLTITAQAGDLIKGSATFKCSKD